MPTAITLCWTSKRYRTCHERLTYLGADELVQSGWVIDREPVTNATASPLTNIVIISEVIQFCCIVRTKMTPGNGDNRAIFQRQCVCFFGYTHC